MHVMSAGIVFFTLGCACAQQDTPVPGALALSELNLSEPFVVTISESAVAAGLNLTEPQRQILRRNLNQINGTIRSFLPPGQVTAVAQLVPGGAGDVSLLKLGDGGFGGAMPADPCAVTEFTTAEIDAVGVLLLKQIRERKEDAAGFVANTPTTCLRARLNYYVKSAPGVAR
jgi:hypothetical protein